MTSVFSGKPVLNWKTRAINSFVFHNRTLQQVDGTDAVRLCFVFSSWRGSASRICCAMAALLSMPEVCRHSSLYIKGCLCGKPPAPCSWGGKWQWLLGRGDKAPYGRSVKSECVLDIEAVASNCCWRGRAMCKFKNCWLVRGSCRWLNCVKPLLQCDRWMQWHLCCGSRIPACFMLGPCPWCLWPGQILTTGKW